MEGYHKSQIFQIFCVFFIAGVLIKSIWDIDIYYILVIAFIAVLFALIRGRKKIIVIGIGFIFLFCGCLRFFLSIPEENNTFIGFYNNKYITFEGNVSEEPDIRKTHTKLKIKVYKIIIENKEILVNGNVLVKTERFPKYNYGDILSVSCKLTEPGKIEKFDYGAYLSRYNIYSTCYNPKIYVKGNKGTFFIKKILNFKIYFSNIINLILHEPQSSFLAGILLGSRKGIDDNLLEAFNITGTTHIIAVSGYNITLIAMLLINLCKSLYIPKRYAFWLCTAGIIVFTFITGASAAVVRSAIMGMFVLVAAKIGRPSQITNSLLLTAFLMVLINPKILVFDVGFQLSFVSTLGLVYFTPFLLNIFKQIPEIFSLKETICTTLAAIIFTAPLILYNFERFSTVALLANILILPAIPLSMLLGFLGVIIGIINILAGQIFSWGAYITLSYIIEVIVYVSKIPYASVKVEGFGLISCLLYCLILFLLLLRYYKNQSNCKMAGKQ